MDEIRNHLVSNFPARKKVGYIIEPAPRNTAPAVILAAYRIYKKDPDAVLGVFPSDHYIEKDEALIEAINRAVEVAQAGYLVTFGLKPDRPETGFGYIEAGEKLNGFEGAHLVKRFVEKPDRERAEEFVRSGRFFWNSGMFVFKAETILEEARKYLPQAVEVIEEIEQMDEEERARLAQDAFCRIESISIDYAIMEKSDRVAVIPVEIGWKDVGSLPALEEFYPKDEEGNVKVGNIEALDTKNSILFSDSRLIAAIGLENLMVIDTRDATLVCSKDSAQKVAEVVKRLKERQADEYLSHRYSVRPWGSFVELVKGENYQIKMIEVNPGMRLSEQMHNHRSEHWIFLQGTAKVYLDGKEHILHANESIFIPMNTRHRLENPGKIPVKLIEVQSGEYLGEDDIIRFSDDYGRGCDE